MSAPASRRDLESPQVRVCVGCGESWHSVKHYSEETSYCDECGLPLVETHTTVVARVSPNAQTFWVPRFG